MNYLNIHDRIIELAKARGIDKSILDGYYEKHHIIPRCMNGTDDKYNLVLLTGREHYLIHYLLWKIYNKNYKLFLAYHKMCYQSRDYQIRNAKITSRQYELLRRDYANHNKTRIITDEMKRKISIANSGRKMTDITKRVLSMKFKDIPRLAYIKEKISQSQRGINNTFYGKKHSDENKQKFSNMHKGRVPIWISYQVMWYGQYFSSIRAVMTHTNKSRPSIMNILNDSNIPECYIIK